MAKKSSMNSSFTSKYRYPPKTTFDTLSDRLNNKKNVAKMEGKEGEPVSKVEKVGSIETGVLPPAKTILVELGALHKILDGLRPDDLESTSAWYSSESCCREIVLRFQNLLREWASDRKKLDLCIGADGTLVKCQKCGVVRCLETPEPLGKIFVEKKSRDKIIAERQTDSIIQTSVGVKRKVTGNVVADQSRCRPSAALVCSWERDAPKKNRLSEASLPKKISIKRSDNHLKKNIPQKIGFRYGETCPMDTHDSTRPSLTVEQSQDKFSDIAGGPGKQLTLAETIEYLTRGNFNDSPETKPREFSDKATLLEATPLFRVPTIRKNPMFDFHGSRDVDFHRSCNFLSNDCPLKLRASDTSNFSSSSAENLMRQWMKTTNDTVTTDLDLGNKSGVEKDNFLCGTRDDLRLNTAPNLAAQIAEAIHKFSERSTPSEDNPYATRTKLVEGNRFKCMNETSELKTTLCTEKQGSACMDDYALNEQESHDFSEKVSKTVWDRKSQSSVVPISVSHFSTDPCLSMLRINSISALTLLPSSKSLNYQIENSERFQREILYDEISSHDAANREGLTSTITPLEILPIYRKILESSETMDWESFERLVTVLHPSQRELWCDICDAVSNEAKRVADETGATTEICIEINPRERAATVGEIRSRGDEITFELDMTLQDVRAIFETCDPPVVLHASTEPEQTK